MRILRLLSVLLVASFVVACSTDTEQSAGGPVKFADLTNARDFAVTVASSDQFEIISSQLALKRSHHKNIRDVAHRMITDHQKSSAELKRLLDKNGMPSPPPGMLTYHREQFDKIANSPDFESAYLDAQAAAHQDAITLFDNYRMHGDNAVLRSFAAKTLPVLKQHYEMIQEAQKHQKPRHHKD